MFGRVGDVLRHGQGAEESGVSSSGSAGVACHIAGRHDQPRKCRAVNKPNCRPPSPQLQERSRGEFLRVGLLVTIGKKVSHDSVSMSIPDQAEGARIARDNTSPNRLIGTLAHTS
ncbi:MAG: hypothetical protein K0R99_4578 [Microbacterium sp.]|nr:hypothetical protein [Microbacterium sp.]